MTASDIAGAASHAQVDWHTIDWSKVHANVRRLQARIVKAIQQGRWGKVKALQHLLTHSFNGKALAVRQVTENTGKRTAGVDGDTWNTPQRKAKAIQQLQQRGYQPRPLRRVYIAKSNGKKRPLGIATMHDRAMQALYLLAMDPIAETQADPNSYGFRKERSPADALQQCHIVLSHRAGAEYILDCDIRSFFDELSHEWLLAHIPTDKAILRKWLKAGFIEQTVLYPTEQGTPQGGPCSPVLANFALNGLEAKLREKYPKATAASRRAKVNLVRFADDIVITGSSQELLQNEVKPIVEAFLRERGLELSTEKTRIVHIESGFDFLGQHIRRYKGRVLIKPSRKNISAFLQKIRAVIKMNSQATAGHLIMQLNPIIRGWTNYHRHVSSKRVFRKVSHAIHLALWQWALRRHSKKPKKWVKAKYFHHLAGQKWVFSGEMEGRNGKLHAVHLLNASSVAIKRHTKIRGTANPYDPVWELYFEERLGVQMASTLKGRRQLLYLWQRQQGICPICEERISKITGWHNHHVIALSKGGAAGAANRVLLHPNCHMQVHNQGLEVVAPRPSRDV